MRVGRTYTAHFDLETRQHELFGMDLGEGVPRRVLAVGGALYALWFLLLWFLVPFGKVTFSLYALPPGVAAFFAVQRARRMPRRRNLTVWAVTARYWLQGHRPVINMGARVAHRSEYLPLAARMPVHTARRLLLPWTEEAPGRTAPSPVTEDETGDGVPAGATIWLRQRARLLGADYVAQVRSARARRPARPAPQHPARPVRSPMPAARVQTPAGAENPPAADAPAAEPAQTPALVHSPGAPPQGRRRERGRHARTAPASAALEDTSC